MPGGDGLLTCENSLAYAELYTAFAYVFRRFNFTLYETTDHDMDWHDAFTPTSSRHFEGQVAH